MADEQGFDPTQYGATAVAEPFDPTQHGAIPVQQPEEPSILQKTGRAVVDTLKGFLPQSVSDVALAPINMIPGFGQAVKPLENIAFGRPVSEGVSPLQGIPVVQRMPQIIQAEKTPAGSQERFTTGAGVVADLAMLAGFKSALHPELAEVAGIPKPEVAPETVTPTPTEPVATDTAAATPIVPEAAQPVVAPEVAPSVPAASEATTAAPLPKESLPVAPDLPTGTGEAPKAINLTEPDTPIEHRGPTLALKLDDGTVVYASDVRLHSQLLEKAGVEPERVVDSGLYRGDEGFVSKTPDTVEIFPENAKQPSPVSEAPVSTTATPLTQTETSISGNKTPVAQTEAVGTGGGVPAIGFGSESTNVSSASSSWRQHFADAIQDTDKFPRPWKTSIEQEGRKTTVVAVDANGKFVGELPRRVGQTLDQLRAEAEDLVSQANLSGGRSQKTSSVEGGAPTVEASGTVTPAQPTSVSVEGQAPTGSVKPKESATSQEIPTGQGERAGGSGSNEPAAQEQVVPPTSVSDDQHISTIANRFTEERTKSGELGEIAPGQGYSTRELADAGLKMSPEEINQHVSDLMNGTGDPIEQGKAVRAEEARLSQRSNDLSRAATADPTNIEARTAADNAFKDVTDFHNGPVAKLKTIFHATGVGLQGELPVDLSTFNGLREKFLRDTGKPPTPEQEPQLRTMAEKVTKSVAEDNGAKQNLGQAIDKATARRKLPTYDEVRQNIADRMKIEPCRT